MKISRVKMTKHTGIVSNNTDTKLDTHIDVLRIPSYKDKLNTLLNSYGEKELKRYGVIKCQTCEKRLKKEKAKKSDGKNSKEKPSLSVCPECGRHYASSGQVDVIKLENIEYGPILELFEGIKLDEKL